MKLDLTKLPVLEGVMLFLLIVLAVAFTLAFITVADDDESSDGDDGVVAETPVDTGNGTPSGDEIAVSMGDDFFDANEFTVAAGATVTFQLTNDGAKTHNMRIAGDDNEYSTDDDALSDPEAFSAGDTGTLVWTAPDSAGEIIFRCDFHTIKMIGTITVQ